MLIVRLASSTGAGLARAKQGARGVVGRMLQVTYPTTPRAPSYSEEGRLGKRQQRALVE